MIRMFAETPLNAGINLLIWDFIFILLIIALRNDKVKGGQK